MHKTYFIRTFGCQMNKNDSEKIAAILEGLGYSEVTEPESASLILLNTCSVRGKSENRMYGWLGKLKSLTKTHPSHITHHSSPILAVCGCIPQHAGEEIFQKAPHVSLIFGVNTIEQLPELLSRVDQGEKHILAIEANKSTKPSINKQSEEIATNPSPIKEPKRSSEHQAWVSIMYGCDNYCSYCIVPFTRGHEVSRSKDEIFAEIEAIDKTRYQEIMLLGQNVNSYGKGLYEDYDFADLLNEASKLAGITKVGFMTSHPKDMSDKLIQTIAENSKISREIHVPIQAGDNEILNRMNRKYTVEDYLGLVSRIRTAIPEAKLSTDIIAGFPGETEEQFQNTLDLVEKVKFSRVNTAAYSPRPLTTAAKFEGQLSAKVKAERLQRLMQVVGN